MGFALATQITRVISTSKTQTRQCTAYKQRISVPMAIAATNPINNKGWDRDQGKAQRISTATIVSWQLPNSKSNDPKREQQKRRSNSTLETFLLTTFAVRDPLL